MYQAVQAIWKEGKIVPLEPFVAEENAPLMVVVLASQAPVLSVEDAERARRVAAVRGVFGKYRDTLSSVDEFIIRKREDLAQEESPYGEAVS